MISKQESVYVARTTETHHGELEPMNIFSAKAAQRRRHAVEHSLLTYNHIDREVKGKCGAKNAYVQFIVDGVSVRIAGVFSALDSLCHPFVFFLFLSPH